VRFGLEFACLESKSLEVLLMRCKRIRFKWLIWISMLLMLLALIGCKNEISERDTVVRDGLLYKISDEHPFTGVVTGRSRDRDSRALYRFEKEYKEGIQDGMTSFWYPNGKLESKATYADGDINGFLITYWPSGKPKSRIHFVNGLRGGSKGEMFWSEDGQRRKS
jgi:MORN repeat variant